MKDAVTVGENSRVSRQQVFGAYVDSFLQLCADVGPCQDEQLLDEAAQFLQREPELTGTFRLFPFHQTVAESCTDTSGDWRRFLSALIKATEFLETLCVNILLQPWRKEIKTVKTFTGPFVYCLLPVFNSFTIQSVLASIGYLPNTDSPTSEYKLSEEVHLDRVKLVGFELMLARVECYHLLELHDRSQVQQQKWLEVLHERLGSTKLEKSTEEETNRGKEEEKRKKGDEDGKEVPLHLDCRPSVTLQHKPLHCDLNSEDQSFIEMQMTYPDLAIRGRPLLPDKPHQLKSGSVARCRALPTVSISVKSDGGKAGTSVKNVSALSATVCSKSDVCRADGVCGDGETCSGCDDGNSGETKDMCDPGGSRGDDHHGRFQATSLHSTTRSGSRAGLSLRAGQLLPPTETPERTQEQTAAGSQEHPALSSTDIKEDIRELEERMDELSLQEAREEVMATQGDVTGGEKTNTERKKRKERKASAEGQTAEQNPLMEPGPAPRQAARRPTTSSEPEPDPAAMKQPCVCPPSLLSISLAADYQSCHEKSKKQGGDSQSAGTC